jgi:phosphoglycolate phosphatase-like HAD superfamily hydrolase
MPRPTVFLFDIDGTLLLTGGAGRRAFDRAFAEVCGRGDAASGFSFAGMTDRAIARAGLAALGREADPAVVDRLIDAYISGLENEVATSDGYALMPNVREVVRELGTRPEFAVGLGTGNVRRGAAIKLARGDLEASFDFGGFGCDAEDRVELLRVGAERGALRLGRPREACRVVVVGDTPRDVAAALALGADCIGVGTGGFAPEELARLGATAAFADLAHPRAVEALVG